MIDLLGRSTFSFTLHAIVWTRSQISECQGDFAKTLFLVYQNFTWSS